MDYLFTSKQRDLREGLRSYLVNKAKGRSLEPVPSGGWSGELCRALAEWGLFGPTLPVQWGGMGLPQVEGALLLEETARILPVASQSPVIHNVLCAFHIFFFGKESQKERYLHSLCSGRSQGVWVFDPMSASPDFPAEGAAARREGEDWVVTGIAPEIFGESTVSLAVVLARTARESGPDSLSALVVESPQARPGRTNRYTGELIGGLGRGYPEALEILQRAGGVVAAFTVGLAARILEEGFKNAEKRGAFESSLLQAADLQADLAGMRVDLEAARLAAYRASVLEDRGRGGSGESLRAAGRAAEVLARLAGFADRIDAGAASRGQGALYAGHWAAQVLHWASLKGVGHEA